jgi:hypothetical protein
MNSNNSTKNANDPPTTAAPAQNPASQPHGSTQDQINEMESEGQATKQGQSPKPSPPGTQATPMPGQKDEKRSTT